MEQTIVSRFSPDDEVYYIDMVSTPSYHKCPLCLGDGKVYQKRHFVSNKIDDNIIDDYSSVICPKCEG